jgi:hypothetical protein
MKYSRVINRPMFNKHNSAYGRGIASNLVTEEQRQRFNYGGRVGFVTGAEVNPDKWLASIGKTAGAAGVGGATVYGAAKVPALYNPSWWQRIKNLGGSAKGLFRGLKPAVTTGGGAALSGYGAAVASPFIAQMAATAQREKGEYLPEGQLLEESETQEFQPGKRITIDDKIYRYNEDAVGDELSFTEQELAGSDIPGYGDIKAERDEEGNIKWHRDERGRVIKHDAQYMRNEAAGEEREKIRQKQLKARVAMGEEIEPGLLDIDAELDKDVVKEQKKVDKVSDTLDWTDQEKKEKMGQILLKGAQRLVGGARDKWGSKEQMKNIGDWFGDVAAIGDKTELRKDERKYKAMSKAYKAIAKDAYETANNYMGLINQNVSHPDALYRTTGIKGGISRPTDKKGREAADKKINDQGPGTIYYDEGENSWNLIGSKGQPIKVTVDKIQEIVKSGLISKLRNAEA